MRHGRLPSWATAGRRDAARCVCRASGYAALRMPPRNYGRRTKLSEERGRRALELWLFGKASYSEIGHVLGISRERAGQLVRGALQRSAREFEDLRRTALQQELARVQLVINEAYEIATRECPKCYGHGTRNSKECRRCTGEGYWHDPVTRGRALDRLLRAGEQRQLLLGLRDETVRHQLLDAQGQPVDPTSFLAGLSHDELERELTYYRLGREDEAANPVTPLGEDELPALPEPPVAPTDEVPVDATPMPAPAPVTAAVTPLPVDLPPPPPLPPGMPPGAMPPEE